MKMNDAIFYKVKSFTNPYQIYTIRHLGFGDWRCECKDFVFRRRTCDHIRKLRHQKMKYHGRKNV